MCKIIHESSIVHLHSQLIPSASRTKTDKIRAARRRKDQNKAMKRGKAKFNDLRFRVQQNSQDEDNTNYDEYEDISDLDQEELAKLNH